MASKGRPRHSTRISTGASSVASVMLSASETSLDIALLRNQTRIGDSRFTQHDKELFASG